AAVDDAGTSPRTEFFHGSGLCVWVTVVAVPAGPSAPRAALLLFPAPLTTRGAAPLIDLLLSLGLGIRHHESSSPAPLVAFVGKRGQSQHLAPECFHLKLRIHVVLSHNEQRFGFGA